MYFKRKLEERLLKSMENHRITVITGPRQAGKTTLLQHIYRQIDFPKLFLDLDILENQEIFNSYSEVLKYLNFNNYRKDKRFVLFLDEFHALPGIAGILKNLHDHEPNLKIYATGSSSLALIDTFKESLAGRKEIFHLFPLSFYEFLYFKEFEYSERFVNTPMGQIPESIKQRAFSLLLEFIIFGGYPEVALTDNREEKKEILRNIFDLFVKKDLIGFLQIKNPQAAINILRYIAQNTGSILNYSDLSTSQHIDINTLKRYLTILNETFVLKTVRPFFSNKNKEIVKSPKVYFLDGGVRNYFVKNFSEMNVRQDAGFLAENFVLSQFVKSADFLTEIKFWRDKNGREVDFIVQKENEIRAYEVKWRLRITRREIASLLFFKRNYPQAKVFLINVQKPNLNESDITELDFIEIGE